MDKEIRMGIIGSGMIAAVISQAIAKSSYAKLQAVASRRAESAQAFAKEHDVPSVFNSWEELIASNEIDAVYVCTPTSVREEIAIAAAKKGLHVLADKPFANLDSLKKIIQSTEDHGVAFMDGTHFVHHPRTKKIQEVAPESVGEIQTIHTSFIFPFSDRNNIRFNPEKEPTGAVGDMAWYSMRAIAEYMPHRGKLKDIHGAIKRDEETNAIIGGTGLALFEKGTSTFSFGYHVGACLMELHLLGNKGMIQVDDFVLDWHSGFAFDNPDHKVGYTYRSEIIPPSEFKYMKVESNVPQATHMINTFAKLTTDPSSKEAQILKTHSLETQELLDTFWARIN